MRKVTKEDLDFIEKTLLDLKIQLDNIKTYLDSNSWVNIQKDAQRQKEFRFQAELYDKYQKWLEKYMELSGIIEFYNESNKDKGDKLRKGFQENHLQNLLKNGELGNMEDFKNE